MKRRSIGMSVVALLAAGLLAGSGCGESSTQNQRGYCDDSGCYACGETGCYRVENQACGAQLACPTDQVCTEFGCALVCSFDSHCGLGERCLAEGYCGPADPGGTSCLDDDECPHGMICDGTVCIDGCQTDEECASEFGTGWVCAPCNRCAPPDNPTCGDFKTYCDANADCGTGRVCNYISQCAYTCDVNSPQCPLGQICDNGVCANDPDPQNPECFASADCSTNTRCETNGCLCVNTYCRTKCDSVDQCGWGEICDLGLCRPNYRPAE